jgi:hypothetical protein
MTSPELKLAEQIANVADNHFFNPGIIAHYLSEQPHYTIDRITELVVHIIRQQAKRHRLDWADGITSEGLFLANELSKAYDLIMSGHNWNNLTLPKTKPLEKIAEEPVRANYSWVHREHIGETAHLNVSAVVM